MAFPTEHRTRGARFFVGLVIMVPTRHVTLAGVPPSLHQELLDDLESRRLTWLRRRFLVFCVLAALICSTGFIAAATETGGHTAPAIMLRLSGMAAWAVGAQIALVLLAGILVMIDRGPRTMRGYLRLAALLVATMTLLQLPLSVVSADMLERLAAAAGKDLNIGFGLPMLLFALVIHLAACLVIPWRPLESLIPIAPLLLVYLTLSAIEFLGGGRTRS